VGTFESGAATTVARGTSAESIAAGLLARSGFRIVARNFRCRAGELDLVALDGSTLVFVEVRSRRSSTFGSALDAIGPRKRAQVTRVARVYLVAHPHRGPIRFDAIAITAGVATHVRDAWRL
jgi:putative endonuclease